MATLSYTNAYFEVNGVDLSNDVSQLTLNYTSEMLDATAMGGDGTRLRKGGLKNWDISVTFHQDFAAGQVDVTLYPLVGTTTCVELRPVNACTTASNPRFSGVCILENYPPMAGTVGELLDVQATFQSASALTRSTTAT